MSGISIDPPVPGDSDGGSAPRVTIDRLSKHFIRAGGQEVKAVDGVSLVVQEKEIVVLLGPSGCGKSTLLRCIAGLEDPSAGTIQIADTVVFSAEHKQLVPPNERDVNMMFQSYALWPHMTLEANVAYPLRVAGVGKREAIGKAREYLELVGLGGLGSQYAGGVSGGQAQRAALARTIIKEPAVVLFDEPLSNVDAQVRSRLRAELLRIHGEVGFSAVYVTHDQIEALGVASRIAVMREGRISQLGTPVEVYDRPSSNYVAEFLGAANLFEATVTSVSPGFLSCDTRIGPMTVSTAASNDESSARPQVGDSLTLLIRPEFWVGEDAGEERVDKVNSFDAQVISGIYAGSRTEYVLKIGPTEVEAWSYAELQPRDFGDRVRVSVDPSSIRVIRDTRDAIASSPAEKST